MTLFCCPIGHAAGTGSILPAPCRGWPRTLARLAAWPLVSGQSASGGSMSRVAEGHFRGKREAPLILRGSTSQFRGHPRICAPPVLLHPFRPRRRRSERLAPARGAEARNAALPRKALAAQAGGG